MLVNQANMPETASQLMLLRLPRVLPLFETSHPLIYTFAFSDDISFNSLSG